MNKAIYNFPKANPITCTWIDTGDPKRPLVRVWRGAKANTLRAAKAAMATTEVDGICLCA